MLSVKNMNVKIADKHVVKDFGIIVNKGEIIVIMGPNGSGKSSFAHALMGHPKFETSGDILLEGKDLLSMSPDERSKNGLFLSFQHPVEIPGVTVTNFLRSAINSRRPKDDPVRLLDFMKLLHQAMDTLHIPRAFANRYVNEGFSGGEKKKMEILQLALLRPKIALLDETDSGLDIDALRKVCEGINVLKEQNPDMSFIIITHYQRMLNYITPDKVCIMLNGTIVRSDGPGLVLELESKGFEAFKN